MSIIDKLLNKVGLSWSGDYSESYCGETRTRREVKPSAAEFFRIAPKKPAGLIHGSLKKQAQKLLDDVAYYVDEINQSTDPFDFIFSFEKIRDITNQLIWLNEIGKVNMYPSPRMSFEDIARNFDKSIDLFISRAIANINSTGMDRINDIIDFLNLILYDPDFFLFPQNINKITAIIGENKANLEAMAHQLEIKENCAENKTETNMQSQIDCAAIIKDEENWRREQRGLTPIENELFRIDTMDGHLFEEWCADLLRKNGFENVFVTPGSNDQGVDIVAEKEAVYYAIQCKCYSNDLGNTPVQEVYAGKEMYNCQVGVVMTNRHFTDGAKALAQKTRVLLWDREKIIEYLKSQV